MLLSLGRRRAPYASQGHRSLIIYTWTLLLKALALLLGNHDDFLIAFLHWRAVLIKNIYRGKAKNICRGKAKNICRKKIKDIQREEAKNAIPRAVYRALCLGQMARDYNYNWENICYHTFFVLSLTRAFAEHSAKPQAYCVREY